MKALLIGAGGIGQNVYLPQLIKKGFTVDTVDSNLPATFDNVDKVDRKYEVAIICTPNFTHFEIATYIAKKNIAPIVFVEKPGFASADMWSNTVEQYKATKFIMCKNNLYRDKQGAITGYTNDPDADKMLRLDIKWLNNNRVPNPGGWSTNKNYAGGGVALDLFPHLYCQFIKMFDVEFLQHITRTSYAMTQQWKLGDMLGSDYGNVDPNGTYDVCDFAQETWQLNDTIINIEAGWKAGIDDQAITVHTKDSSYKWNFGLCPDYAYGEMIVQGLTEDYDYHKEIDTWIHKQLEVYYEG